MSTRAFGRRHPRAGWVVGFVIGAIGLDGCAPRPFAPLDANAIRGRFTASVAARRARAGGLETTASLWLETPRAGRWPGVLSDLRVTAPDRIRLVVRSPLGTLLDAAARGDRVVALLPRRRAYAELEGDADSLGVAGAARFAIAAALALWQPTDAAWDSALTVTNGRRLSWHEAAGDLELTLARDGAPLSVLRRGADGTDLVVRYEDWSRALDANWPSRVRIEDAAGRGSLTCRMERWRSLASADSGRLAAAPVHGERLDARALRQWLGRLVEP